MQEDDYYIFDDVHHQLKGERTGRTFQLGDTIKIQVASVSLDDRQKYNNHLSCHA